ncbi:MULTISPECIES: ParA family protein [Streptomyces]|uniref:ParA family protein n=1 Tax=Streptomyces TaxID=1883 RepID=UPI00099E7C7B|nr:MULTISPECIES: ParA family protein [Streptomyces]MDX3840066.1 ParA family protein [Streptomyces europaeiscabiei]
MAKKIAIAIHKGGVGKTTTAKNIAAAMALAGHRTLLVDLDEQANATKGLGIDPAGLPVTLNNLFVNPEIEIPSAVLETLVDGLHLIAGHPDLSRTETGMALQRTDPTAPDPIAALKGLLAELEDDYDFIILDTPPSLNYMTINALAAADELVIPAAASAYSQDGLARTIEAYERAVGSYNPTLRLRGILVTRFKRTLASSAVFDGIGEAYKDLVIPQLIVESTAVDEAEQLNQPVVIYDPQSHAAQGYKRVAEILTNG